MKKPITNRQLVLRITLSLLLGSIISGILFSLYLKNIALNTLAKDGAQQTSELVFEVMRTKMVEGWGKEDLIKIIRRLEGMKKGLVIHTYRSSSVQSLYGDDPLSVKELKNSPDVNKAMGGKEIFNIDEDDSIRFLYPLVIQKECVTCHYNMQVGDVAGVLDVYFPSSKINIPLSLMIVYFILFLIFFLILVFFIFYNVLNEKMVSPLVDFTSQMHKIIETKDMDKRVVVHSYIKEILELGEEFNNLLDKIKYYYERLISQFFVDQLTSLPNLLALKKDIQSFENPTLIIFNINQFRNINNFYGYGAGDFILTELAKLIDGYKAKGEKVYRISGDEFGWLIEGSADIYLLLEIIEELQEHAFLYKNSEIRISMACGIADKKERLIENATSSLYKAKKSSKPLEVYDPSVLEENKIEQNIYWTKKLKDALNEDRIIIYFQPILDVHLKRANKFETLVRLQDTDGTIYSPWYFMDVAKLSRLYLRLSRCIMKQAFEYFKDKPYQFSVNISMDDIIDFSTRNYILMLLKNFPEPQRVVFEILETEEITEFELINSFSKEAKELGAKLAIDDFGSGYSNYDYIIKLNIDFLKIDSSLIKNIDTDENMAIIVESIIGSAQKLGLKTIAEYVHSKDVMDKVKELGVDFIQGYYIDQPLPNVELHTEK